MSYLHRDIVENIIINSNMKEVEMLCMSNKEIGTVCNDRRIWDILVEKHDIKLFKDLGKINSYKEFMEAYKIYKKYENQAEKIITYANQGNRYIYIDLNIDLDLKANLLDFIYENMYKTAWRGYGTGYKIPVKLREINFDFNNDLLLLLYENNGILHQEPSTRTKERMLTLLTGILYYYPTIDLKLGNALGGDMPNIFTATNIPVKTNIRYLNKRLDDSSAIKKCDKVL